MRRVVAALALAAVVGSAANAQTIFRCGNEYRQVACDVGAGLVVASAVTAEQRAEAREVARREKALAAEMVRDRRVREAALKPALAGSLSAPKVAAPAAPAAAKKKAKKRRRNAWVDGQSVDEQRDFIAAVPKAKRAGS